MNRQTRTISCAGLVQGALAAAHTACDRLEKRLRAESRISSGCLSTTSLPTSLTRRPRAAACVVITGREALAASIEPQARNGLFQVQYEEARVMKTLIRKLVAVLLNSIDGAGIDAGSILSGSGKDRGKDRGTGGQGIGGGSGGGHGRGGGGRGCGSGGKCGGGGEGR